ncbi:hypothetical protein GDO81_018031 [Engystomops pustulosus]|uniref:Uncharacterized protein n=1 Tax=Engystomops pustulosus TaxID=76066 RepID=A0AAV7A406_ENGPU|nr:hypothetical protein GDO81_018031 [Engystomops pustulosus]
MYKRQLLANLHNYMNIQLQFMQQLQEKELECYIEDGFKTHNCSCFCDIMYVRFRFFYLRSTGAYSLIHHSRIHFLPLHCTSYRKAQNYRIPEERLDV